MRRPKFKKLKVRPGFAGLFKGIVAVLKVTDTRYMRRMNDLLPPFDPRKPGFGLAKERDHGTVYATRCRAPSK
jgi:hypothetical protein